jgi:signal transduction histidine kinase
LGRAAARVGAGQYDVQVAPVPRTPELNVLVDAFNAMAAKVAGHTEELQREVERATEETARRERALIVSSRLAAMGTLAAGISHEINNPIGGMLNAARRLAQREDIDERSKLYLDLILEGLERIAATARKILDFSPRQIQAAPFRLADAVEGARVLVEHRCEHEGVELQVRLPDDLPELTGDRHEIQQVVLNCLLNSLDALQGQARPRRIEVGAALEGQRLCLRIDDNGPGADADTLSRVMDPFFSTKDRPSASGLGLFICYAIVKNHGGEMEVESRPGAGFHVTIRLPVRR